MKEEHLEMLSQGMMKSSSLQTIQLSNNQLGSTALNWLTTALSQYSIDYLDMSSGYQPPVSLNKFIAKDFGDLMLVDEMNLERISTNMLRTRIDTTEDINAEDIEPVMRALSPGRDRWSPMYRMEMMAVLQEEDERRKQQQTSESTNRKFYLELFGKRYLKQIQERKRAISEPREPEQEEEQAVDGGSDVNNDMDVA
jgi:hypothetical protein